ncbi:lymphocyte function-associated antigen 3-like [Megalops cyprinoides]|uniref:lymphocyte function-associated antigen 3-like n=1 Tax=Megalops cyprinoides TaxID=118141 RepID=UPI0018647E71|nr:lymphocyte function-associated antigen 3-like [Megalops cyprinoides]
MAARLHRIKTLVFIITNFTFVSGEAASVLYGKVDGTITLRPAIDGQWDEILWKHNGNKVVEFDQKNLNEFGQFKGRTALDVTRGDLTIKNLIENDSGDYKAELQIAGHLKYYHKAVKVIDVLKSPTVTCQANGTMVTLLCAGDLSPVTQYSWEGPEAQNQSGPELRLQRKESSDSVYTCVLSNPVSQSSEKFNIQSCFPAGDEEDDSVPVVAIVVCLLLLLLLLLLILGLLFMYRKKYWSVGRGKRGKEENPEAPPEDESAQLISPKHENQQSPVQARDSMTKETVGLSQEESQAGEWRGAGIILNVPTIRPMTAEAQFKT